MSRRHKIMGGAVAGGLCLASFASSGEPPRSALCQSPPHQMTAIPRTAAQWAAGAQLFEGLGDFHRVVTMSSQAAQTYFDQGMRYLWAFNHDEATRSFAKAAQLDPQCAMCYWGLALTVGPNYNLPMMAEPRARVAWEALQQAQAHARQATPIERALIGALASRYPNAQPLDPVTEQPVLIAYAEAMKAVAAGFPGDDDVQILTAEAMMNVNAWKLWALDGTPAPGTEEVVARLEGVLGRNPLHPGANHYYIHVIEASSHPEKAVAAAERLPGMMPAAGHLEHMPAHIMQRVGRYEDAAEANRRGAAADLAYFAKTKPLDYYAMYTAHNYQFLAFSAAMEGRKAETIEAARKSRAIISDDLLLAMPGLDWSLTELYTGMVRFGLWEDILAEPAPNSQLTGLTTGYLYATAAALAAKGRVDEAKVKLSELEKLVAATPPDAGAGLNTLADLLAVAVISANARIASAEQREEEAIAILREAVAREDRLAYDEPADWFVPTRQLLGAALVKLGRATNAETVYREDLARHPTNGWSLYGLAQSLRMQGRNGEAQAVHQQFEAARKNADVTLVASAF